MQMQRKLTNGASVALKASFIMPNIFSIQAASQEMNCCVSLHMLFPATNPLGCIYWVVYVMQEGKTADYSTIYAIQLQLMTMHGFQTIVS